MSVIAKTINAYRTAVLDLLEPAETRIGTRSPKALRLQLWSRNLSEPKPRAWWLRRN